MASNITTPENARFCQKLKDLIAKHLDQEKLKSKRVKLEAIGYKLDSVPIFQMFKLYVTQHPEERFLFVKQLRAQDQLERLQIDHDSLKVWVVMNDNFHNFLSVVNGSNHDLLVGVPLF
ncbi:hypothetical protein Tco_0489579 [Tanacetum coccineum]